MTRPSRDLTYAVGVATALTAIAMWRYPGGTALDAHTAGYQFTQNFLSDLGMTVAYNGAPNRLGATCFIVALCALVIGAARALAHLARVYSATPRARAFARAAGAIGFLSCAAFVGVAATPENSAMPWHVQFTLLAFRLMPFAALALAVATRAIPALPRRVSATWLALTGVLAAYVALLAWHPAVRTADVLAVQVIAQKVVSIVSVGVLLLQTRWADSTV